MNSNKPCIPSRSNTSWPLQTSAGHEESFCFRKILLSGPPSCGSATDVPKGTDAGRKNTEIPNGTQFSVISTLISTSLLPRLLNLVSSISRSPPAIGDSPPYAIRVTQNKGLGMFARRDIQKGELIVWERPAVIVPGLERDDMAQEAYRLLAEGFFELDNDTCVEGEIELGSIEEIQKAGEERYQDVRRMAISGSFEGGHWLEGVVRTNALVLEFEDGQKRSKEEREIYGGVYPLINRCNHTCVPNAAVHFVPTLLTSCLYALRHINAGEEITKSYVNPLLPRQTRMKTLRDNYGFECDCRSCTLSPQDSAKSDERRSQLATSLSTATFTRWASDLARDDDFLAEKHRLALELVEEEQVWAVESVLLEEMALACAMMGDRDGFTTWARKMVDAGQWVGQVGESPPGREVKEKKSWGKWVWWLEDPERRVKRWGWRKMMREEMNRRKSGIELEDGMLEMIFKA